MTVKFYAIVVVCDAEFLGREIKIFTPKLRSSTRMSEI